MWSLGPLQEQYLRTEYKRPKQEQLCFHQILGFLTSWLCSSLAIKNIAFHLSPKPVLSVTGAPTWESPAPSFACYALGSDLQCLARLLCPGALWCPERWWPWTDITSKTPERMTLLCRCGVVKTSNCLSRYVLDQGRTQVRSLEWCVWSHLEGRHQKYHWEGMRLWENYQVIPVLCVNPSISHSFPSLLCCSLVSLSVPS